jgi:hypothetical protein
LITPFSYFVPNITSIPWISDFNKNLSFAVKAEGIRLEVEMVDPVESTKGFCMDVFHPKFALEFLYPALLKNMTDYYQGYYLENNVPYINRNNHEFYDVWTLPYRPNNAFNSTTLSTLPELATHDISGG